MRPAFVIDGCFLGGSAIIVPSCLAYEITLDIRTGRAVAKEQRSRLEPHVRSSTLRPR
jgi:hypothetical protein